MFGLWIREIVGWLFVALGVYGYWICLAFLAQTPPQLIQGGILAGVATVLFRGGLALVRVSAAARVVARPDAGASTRKDL